MAAQEIIRGGAPVHRSAVERLIREPSGTRIGRQLRQAAPGTKFPNPARFEVHWRSDSRVRPHWVGQRTPVCCRAMLHPSTQHCVVKRPALLQLYAAINRLKDEGWKCDHASPSLASAADGQEGTYWW